MRESIPERTAHLQKLRGDRIGKERDMEVTPDMRGRGNTHMWTPERPMTARLQKLRGD